MNIKAWLTAPQDGTLFQRRDGLVPSTDGAAEVPTIEVDPGQQFQEIDGFGYALTGGSAMLLNQMTASARSEILQELFGTEKNDIGVSYLRLSIGASDLNDRVFSYSNLAPGETDFGLEGFSLAPDREDLIPVLREILAISPAMKILGSPWSPPVWMKSNQDSVGGSLLPEFYDSYAEYFVKYIQGMRDEGIKIDAVTVQNEPLHPGNNPSLLMQASEQAVFVKQSLGPALREAGLQTKIIIYDHNADRTDYPLEVLSDPEAAQYIDGSAFHLYAGSINALSEVHDARPDKNLYFTEQWVGAPADMIGELMWHTKNLIIGATRNWCRNVIEWNLASDPDQNPHTEGGCTSCLGAITIDGDAVTRNPAYYIIAHAAKFVRPGSVRIHSDTPGDVPNVAFATPDGEIVLITLNETEESKSLGIQLGDLRTSLALPAKSVVTSVAPVVTKR